MRFYISLFGMLFLPIAAFAIEDITAPEAVARYSRRMAPFTDGGDYYVFLDERTHAQIKYVKDRQFLVSLTDSRTDRGVDAVGMGCTFKNVAVTIERMENNGDGVAPRLHGTGMIDGLCRVKVEIDPSPSLNITVARTNLNAGKSGYNPIEIKGCESICPRIGDFRGMEMEYRLTVKDRDMLHWANQNNMRPGYWSGSTHLPVPPFITKR